MLLKRANDSAYQGFRAMIYDGVISYGDKKEGLDDIFRVYCASVARKVLPSGGDYAQDGWSEEMTGPGL